MFNKSSHLLYYSLTVRAIKVAFCCFNKIIRILQDFLNADEIQHLEKKAAITNLSNDVIVNKKFLRKEIAMDTVIDNKHGM